MADSEVVNVARYFVSPNPLVRIERTRKLAKRAILQNFGVEVQLIRIRRYYYTAFIIFCLYINAVGLAAGSIVIFSLFEHNVMSRQIFQFFSDTEKTILLNHFFALMLIFLFCF